MREHHSVRMAIAACAVITSCNQGPKPCLQPRHCDEGYECLASRCMPLGADPVPEQSERRVLRPTKLGVDARGAQIGWSGVQLHSMDGQERELLMEFDLSEVQDAEVVFLILSAVDLPPGSLEPTELRVARVTDPWSEASLQRGSVPQRDFEQVSGLLMEGQRARVDVTQLVQTWLGQPQRSYGFVVSCPNPSQLVVALEGPTRTPSLELYSRAEGKRP